MILSLRLWLTFMAKAGVEFVTNPIIEPGDGRGQAIAQTHHARLQKFQPLASLCGTIQGIDNRYANPTPPDLMKPALLMMFLVALMAVSHAQTLNRSDSGVFSEPPEQRRNDLRSVLKFAPVGPNPVNETPSASGEARRRLSEDERAKLRQQLRQQAGEGTGQSSRAALPCGRGPATPPIRSPDDNCY
jgi:hypothetical protein